MIGNIIFGVALGIILCWCLGDINYLKSVKYWVSVIVLSALHTLTK